MPAVIWGFVSRWLGGGTGVLLIIACVAIGGGWVWHSWKTAELEARLAKQQQHNTALQANVEEWKAASEARQHALDILREEARAARAANAKLKKSLAQKDQAYEALHQQIVAAPEADDGPVAPVLRHALEGLP